MSDKPVIMIIGSECDPRWEEAWSKWYSEKHLPDVFNSCKATKATRYKIAYLKEEKTIVPPAGERVGTAYPLYPPYLALYHFNNWKDVISHYKGEAHKWLVEEWNRDWVSKGVRVVWRIFYEQIRTWDKGPLVGDKPAIVFIGSECPPEHQKAWGKWYEEKHIPDFLKVKGIKNAARYKIIVPKEADGITPTQNERTGEATYAPFLAVYGFDSFKDIEGFYYGPMYPAFVEDWKVNWGHTEARVLRRAFYEQIKTWEK